MLYTDVRTNSNGVWTKLDFKKRLSLDPNRPGFVTFPIQSLQSYVVTSRDDEIEVYYLDVTNPFPVLCDSSLLCDETHR